MGLVVAKSALWPRLKSKRLLAMAGFKLLPMARRLPASADSDRSSRSDSSSMKLPESRSRRRRAGRVCRCSPPAPAQWDLLVSKDAPRPAPRGACRPAFGCQYRRATGTCGGGPHQVRGPTERQVPVTTGSSRRTPDSVEPMAQLDSEVAPCPAHLPQWPRRPLEARAYMTILPAVAPLSLVMPPP